MTTTIESILATPDKKKETEYNIITAISKDIGRGYLELKNTVVGGGGKNIAVPKKRGESTIVGGQITTTAEQRESTRVNKRKSI